MDASPLEKKSARAVPVELAGIFFISLLLAALRVVLAEPSAHDPAILVMQLPGSQKDANWHYDRQNDERDFYLPAIQRTFEHWPKVEWVADAATHKPPGYPFFMATVAKVVGLDFGRLRWVQMFLSALIPTLLYFWLREQWSVICAAAIIAPLVLSSFLIKGAVYLTTDNPALLSVAVVLFLLMRGQWSAWSLGGVAVGSVIAISIRQDTVWVVGPTALLCGYFFGRNGQGSPSRSGAFFQLQRGVLVVATLLPVVMVAWLWAAGKGLVPPSYYGGLTRAGFGLTPGAYLLSVVAIFWWPFLLSTQGFRVAAKLATTGEVLIWALGGLAIAIAADTTYNPETGKWGGYLWMLSSVLPHIAGRSLPFLLLAPLGALALGMSFRLLGRETPVFAAILGAGFLAWMVACTPNPYVFHRYYEPTVLVFLIATAAVLGGRNTRAFSIRNYAPLLLIAGMQLAITAGTLYLSLFPGLRR